MRKPWESILIGYNRKFEKGKINLKKSFYNTNYNMSPCIVLDKAILMSEEWNKYLNALRKV